MDKLKVLKAKKVSPFIRSLVLGLAVFGVAPASFAASTDWHETLGGKLRLISGGQQDGQVKAGLEIVLEDGWKTYWKVPGESGIPPQLDFSASGNIANLDIKWPVPKRHRVGESFILGYKEAIVFPILIEPASSDKPVNLQLDALIGLCSDLCVPLSATLSLAIPHGGDRDLGAELLIDRDLALVPGEPTPDFAIQSIEHGKGAGEGRSLRITARIPDGYGEKDLFVEGPQNWLLPLADRIDDPAGASPQGSLLFKLALEGVPDGDKTKDAVLTFTLTNGEEAITQSITLDQ